jgi:hypothetical protein
MVTRLFFASFFLSLGTFGFTQDTGKFAPGTLITIQPENSGEETMVGPMPLGNLSTNPDIRWSAPDFPDGKPLFDAPTRTLQEMAKEIRLRWDVYCLEFSFKEMRFLTINIRQPDGSTKPKVIYYLVYRLRYRGGDLRPAAQVTNNENLIYSKLYSEMEGISYNARRAFPLFSLRTEEYDKEYLDRIIPAAKDEIARREKIFTQLYNSVEITTVSIPRTTDPEAPGIWGVATWEDIDPRADFISVFVYGISNAVKRTEEGKLIKKVLQLNFHRPGDTIVKDGERILYGIPAFKNLKEQQYILDQYKLPERLDHRWIFR